MLIAKERLKKINMGNRIIMKIYEFYISFWFSSPTGARLIASTVKSKGKRAIH